MEGLGLTTDGWPHFHLFTDRGQKSFEEFRGDVWSAPRAPSRCLLSRPGNLWLSKFITMLGGHLFPLPKIELAASTPQVKVHFINECKHEPKCNVKKYKHKPMLKDSIREKIFENTFR